MYYIMEPNALLLNSNTNKRLERAFVAKMFSTGFGTHTT